MALATDIQARRQPAGPAPAASGSRADRDVAFARARRHSRFVRMLKVLLPVATIATLSSYALFMQHTIKVGDGKLTIGPVSLSTDVLTMHNPRYEGYNQDGSRFNVTAKSAEQTAVSNDAPVKLNDITGNIVQPNKVSTQVAATSGLFDPKSHELELFESINIDSSDGMKARLTSAKVFMKDSRIVSNDPVSVEMPSGVLKGNAMVILQKQREVTFSNGVTARLQPAEKKAPATGAAPPSATSSLMGNSNAPVDIAAPTLRVDDANKRAIFSENVRAEQDGAILTSRTLEVAYDGNATDAASPPTGTPAGAPTGAMSGRLKGIVARDDVVLIRGDDRVTAAIADFDTVNEAAVLAGGVNFTSGADREAIGDRADLNFRADTALLTGRNVVVTQGKNVLRGRSLYVNRKAGTMQLSSPSSPDAAEGRIAARFQQPEGSKPKKAQPAAQEGGGLQFRTDPNAPIDIEANILDVDDTRRTATFHGDVLAVQGDFTIRTVEMIATYSGTAGMQLMQQPAADAGSKAPAQLQRVQARKKVLVTSKDGNSATGDWADYDVKANTVTLGGDVVLNQGRNVVRGPKLVIDMVTGLSRMEGEQRPSGAAAPATASDTQPGQPGACGGRMCAVFYPKDAKDAAKKGVAKIAPAQPGQGKAGPGASSWNSTTTPGGE